MTQYERAMSGKLFDARTKELVSIKHKAHLICQQYNALPEDDPHRQELIREMLGATGETFYFQGPIQFNYGCNTKIGDHFFCNFDLTVLDDGPVEIGDYVMIGPNVSIMATNHPLLYRERETLTYPDGHVSMSEFAEGIHIGSHVWIASRTVICDGVTIGDGAVIGAGSIVTRDIPAGWVAFGAPCKPVRPITEADSRMDLY